MISVLQATQDTLCAYFITTGSCVYLQPV